MTKPAGRGSGGTYAAGPPSSARQEGPDRRAHVGSVVAAAAVAVAAGTLLLETIRYPGTTALYPSAVLVGLVVLMAAVAVQNLRTPAAAGAERQTPVGSWRPVAFAVAWFTYPLSMMLLGFVVATSVAMIASLAVLRIKHLPLWAGGTFPMVVGLLLVLQMLFNIALPQGPIDLVISDFFYSL